jgi:hypothetical protein
MKGPSGSPRNAHAIEDRSPGPKRLPAWWRVVMWVLLALICLAIWFDVAVAIANQSQQHGALPSALEKWTERIAGAAAYVLFFFAFWMMFSEPPGLGRHMAGLYVSSGLIILGIWRVATYEPWTLEWVTSVLVFRVLPCVLILTVLPRHWARLERARVQGSPDCSVP